MSAKVLERRPSLREFEVFKEQETASYTAAVLKQNIDTKHFVDTGIISNDERGLLNDFLHGSPEDQANLVLEADFGRQLPVIFSKLLLSVFNDTTVQYLLAVVDTFLSKETHPVSYEEHRKLFRAVTDQVDVYSPYLRILQRGTDHAYTQAKACRILACLLSGVDSVSIPAVDQFLNYLVSRVEGAKGGELLLTVMSLKEMLQNGPEMQRLFVDLGGLRPLAAVLRRDTQNTQLIYVTTFCIWLLSFNPDEEVARQLLAHEMVHHLVEVLKAVMREKVVRLVFATFVNLINRKDANEAMIASGLMKILPTLQGRKWADEDLERDMKQIDEVLQRAVALLSSFEKYEAETLSGNLQWSPVHSEKFWRENCNLFDKDHYTLIKLLVGLLDSDDELTLEVACYDLGEFARFHPEGKKVLAQLGGKSKLMQKMTHKSPRVAKQALLAVQKLMVHNWESLGGSSANTQAPSA